MSWQVPVCLRLGVSGGPIQRCELLRGPEATVELGAECPAWLFPDAGGTGYYRWALASADLARLRSRGLAHLDAAERLSLARNVRASQRAGALPYEGAMDALAALATDPAADVAGAGMDAIRQARDLLLDDADRGYAEASSG